MKITGKEPAFPQIETELKTHGYGTYPWSDVESKGGLTIRQQFAMAAMQGLLASTNGTFSASHLAYTSVQTADALIDELNKQSGE